MNKIILSSGIEGIDWRQSINLLVGASSNISHFDNVMVNTKGKYDDLIFEKAEINPTHKKLKPQFKGYLTRLLKNEKSQVSVLSDPIFLDSGAAMQTLNSDKTFAFFFCSPEYYLAKMEDATGDGENIDQQECLDNWLEGACKMWEFYVCYPDSTLLINIEDVARDPQLNASKVFEFVGCELDDIDNNQAANSVDTAVANPIEKLSLLLLQNMKLETIKASSELNERYENLAVTSILADNALSYDPSERAGMRLSECQKLITVMSTNQVQLEFDLATLAASNSELIGDNEKFKAEFATRSSALETSLSECKAENELAFLQINQQQEELETSYLNAKELKGEFATQTSGLETHLADLKAENELALLQINQQQEELETSYLNAKELKGEFATQTSGLETHLADLKAENELALLQINQQQEELETSYLNAKELKGEFATQTSGLETHLADLKVENELALLQINQLQEELEATYLNAEKVKGELAVGAKALETQLTKFKAENELAAVKINQLEEELETAYSNAEELKGESASRATTFETSLSELTAENELALLQINQLQEELEAAYLNAEKVKGELAVGAKALKTQLKKFKAENELAAVKINQLEEELETAYSNAKELNRKSATRTSALETSLSGHKAANELALLQIHQLQEELETAHSNSKELKGESATRTSALETSLSELTAENEQAFLQINHLQEELEHYYIQYQKMTYSPNTEIRYATDLNRVKVSLSLMNMN